MAHHRTTTSVLTAAASSRGNAIARAILALGFIFGIAGSSALGLSGAAHAQASSGTPSTTLQKPAPSADAPASTTLPPSGQNLSEKLDRSNGVIEPPARVDPEMAVPPKDPAAGANMPVIRPPAAKEPGVGPK